MQQLTNMLQFDANVDARVNGPLRFKSIIFQVVYVGSCPREPEIPLQRISKVLEPNTSEISYREQGY